MVVYLDKLILVRPTFLKYVNFVVVFLSKAEEVVTYIHCGGSCHLLKHTGTSYAVYCQVAALTVALVVAAAPVVSTRLSSLGITFLWMFR